MIKFDQVTKKFPNKNVVVDAVSFHIEPKEFVFITGHSGAGKTTLLRLLLRELLPTSGAIYVDKTDISTLSGRDIPEFRRQVGAAFQDFKILNDWTVSENIGVGLEILGKDKSEIDDRVVHLLDLIGLSGKGDVFPSQLSGGELQRVVIARALAPEPNVLFADEPTGNLDLETTNGIMQLLRDINDLGTTVIMATHNSRIVDKFKERTISLKKGKIINDTGKKIKRSKSKHITK